MDSNQSLDAINLGLVDIPLHTEIKNEENGCSNNSNRKGPEENVTEQLLVEIKQEPILESISENQNNILELPMVKRSNRPKRVINYKMLIAEESENESDLDFESDTISNKGLKKNRSKCKNKPLTKKQRDRKNASQRHEALTQENIEYRRNKRRYLRRQRIANMDPEQREKMRAERNEYKRMEKQREYNRKYSSKKNKNMTPDEREKMNALQRVQALTKEQLEHRREVKKAYQRRKAAENSEKKPKPPSKKRVLTEEQCERRRL